MKKLPTEKQIDDVLDKCMHAEESGVSAFPGENYEAGVKSAILWMRGEISDNPMEE